MYKNTSVEKKNALLKDFNNDNLVILTNEEVEIDRKNISQIKTVYNW